MELSRLHRFASQGRLNSEQGFAKVLVLALLPIILSGFFFIFYSQFNTTNWMRAVHTCRTELLKTQKKVSADLKQLMQLNVLVRTLRAAVIATEIELAAAIASFNYPLAGKLTHQLYQLKQRQQQLDKVQRALIAKADLEMNSGLSQVSKKLKQQSSEIQGKLPEFFSYRIHSIRFLPNTLAVKPDQADVAPVYELKDKFKDAQSLHVSWTSEFETKQQSRYKWITNHHRKIDGCSVSLEEDDGNYKEILVEDKSLLKF